MGKAKKIFIGFSICGLLIAAMNLPEAPKTSPGEQISGNKSTPIEQTGVQIAELAKKATNSEEVTSVAQVDAPGKYLVEIRIKRDPFTGGQSDWNSIASETFTYSKKLLANTAVARLHFTFYSPENNNVDWAHIWVDPRKLTDNWKDSYLLFFSKVQVDASSVSSAKWLSDFYAKYETARPL
uniref:PLAT domain-containing protein n=1 Tax=Geobacter sp. (strain M21) TaxID=443144 RepID=C6E6U6_GEOSM